VLYPELKGAQAALRSRQEDAGRTMFVSRVLDGLNLSAIGFRKRVRVSSSRLVADTRNLFDLDTQTAVASDAFLVAFDPFFRLSRGEDDANPIVLKSRGDRSAAPDSTE